MTRGLFSIVIPAHRAAPFLADTLGCVAAQQETHWELLVYEDGRFDETAAIVHGFSAGRPQRVALLGSPDNRGVSHARNRAMEAASGDTIAFLDADDLWSPDHLTHARSTLASADVAVAGVTFVDALGNPLPGRAEPGPDAIANPAPSLFRYNFVQCTSTLCVRRESLDRAGSFDEGLTHGEDLDLWLRLVASGARFAATGAFTCAYRKHAASAMHRGPLVLERMALFYEKHLRNPLLPLRDRRHYLGGTLRDLTRMTWRREPARAAAASGRLFRLTGNPLWALVWAACSARSRLR